MALTNVQVKNLKARTKPYKVSDFDGLHVLVNPGGSKLWRFKYRIMGKERLLSIGAWPEVSLLQARNVRDDARAKLALGVDPSEAKQEQAALAKLKQENSFERVAESYVDKIRKEGRAPATLTKVTWYLSMANAAFGHRPITEISAPIVLKCLKKIEKRGTYETANRMRSTIGAVFRYAIANTLAEVDPTWPLRDALIRPTVTPRAAITDKAKLGGLLRAIDGYDGRVTTCIGLQLLAIVANLA